MGVVRALVYANHREKQGMENRSMSHQAVAQETLALARDCDAVLIPDGTSMRLSKGTMVTIMQRLGPHFTVQVYHHLVRIRGQDADALHTEPVTIESRLPANAPLEDRVWEQLRTCYDPEIPVNVVDLGLIYTCVLTPVAGVSGRYTIRISMTLTAPGCGMGPVLVEDVQHVVSSLVEVDAVQVALVFDPPWDRGRLSEAARLQLGLL